MAYLEITVDTASDSIEDVAAALTAGGFADLVIEDQAEFAQFLDQNRAYWDYIDEELEQKLQGLSHIKLYLEEEDEAGLSRLKALVQQLQEKGSFGELALHIAPLAEVDWEESWKESYPPQCIGEKLLVLPYWLAETDTEGRLPVILDPGLTFGTGAHPSTQMVMAFMEQLPLAGKKCIDLGSGSGILSIAALRLGAKSAVGVDIDPKAEDIARQNCSYNGFSAPEFTAFTGNVLSDKKLMAKLSGEKYDLVLVNIVADVIVALSPVLPNFLAEDGTLILSGILDSRLADVKQALHAAGLTVTAVGEKEEWRSITAKRSSL